MLFDDKEDPCQLENLVDKPEYAVLQKDLDDRLQSLLRRIGDDFRPGSSYIEEWGFKVNPKGGSIPYRESSLNPQTPKRSKRA